MARHGSVFCFGWAFADHDFGSDESLSSPRSVLWGLVVPAQFAGTPPFRLRAPRPCKTDRSLRGRSWTPSKSTLSGWRSVRDSRLRPATVLPAAVAPSDPTHSGPTPRSRRQADPALTERVVRCELRHLGTSPISVPLIVARYSRFPPRVAALRRSSLEIVDGDRPMPGDRTNPNMRAFKSAISSRSSEGQVTARQWRERLHPATLPEPARSDSRRQSCRHAGFLARQPAGNTFPETLLMLTTPPRRATRRPHRRTQRPISRSTFLRSQLLTSDHQLNPPCHAAPLSTRATMSRSK